MSQGQPEYTAEAEVAKNLVEQIVSGDHRAEAEMVSRYERGLITMLRNRSKDRHVAEEVAQDTWMVVLTKVRKNELRDASKLAAFISQVGRNQLLMRYRSQARDPQQLDEPDTFQAQKLSPEDSLVNNQLGAAIEKMFGMLSQDRDRQILQQFYHVGVSKQELCRRFSLSDSHFDRVLFRARERFKSIWEAFDDT